MFKPVDISQHSAFTEVFADRLRLVIRRRFGRKLPSASVLAAALNTAHRLPDLREVPAETVRRWVRGVSVPDVPNLSRLCHAFDLQPAEVCDLLLIRFWVAERGAALDKESATCSRSLRCVLHELVDQMDEETLTQACLSLVKGQGMHQIGAGGG